MECKKTECGDMTNKKKFVKEFETMRETAEMRALSKVSLERPLSDYEYQRFIGLGKKYGMIV